MQAVRSPTPPEKKISSGGTVRGLTLGRVAPCERPGGWGRRKAQSRLTTAEDPLRR
jgi:hypothetical protein